MKPAAKNNGRERKLIVFLLILKSNYKNNVTANPEVDSSTIKKLLVDQIHSTVKWRESLI